MAREITFHEEVRVSLNSIAAAQAERLDNMAKEITSFMDNYEHRQESLRSEVEAKMAELRAETTTNTKLLLQGENRKIYSFLLSEALSGSRQLIKLLRTVEMSRGFWERVAGGLLLISMPSDSTYDPTADVIALRNGRNGSLE
jgi:hypothetical protein